MDDKHEKFVCVTNLSHQVRAYVRIYSTCGQMYHIKLICMYVHVHVIQTKSTTLDTFVHAIETHRKG